MALTPVQSLYDAFLVLIESDEWDALEEFQAQIDFKQLALAAKPWFKFPRCSLEWDANAEYFIDENITLIDRKIKDKIVFVVPSVKKNICINKLLRLESVKFATKSLKYLN